MLGQLTIETRQGRRGRECRAERRGRHRLDREQFCSRAGRGRRSRTSRRRPGWRWLADTVPHERRRRRFDARHSIPFFRRHTFESKWNQKRINVSESEVLTPFLSSLCSFSFCWQGWSTNVVFVCLQLGRADLLKLKSVRNWLFRKSSNERLRQWKTMKGWNLWHKKDTKETRDKKCQQIIVRKIKTRMIDD